MRSARNKTLFNLISLGILYSIAVSPQLLADTPTSLLPNKPDTLSKTAPDQQEKKITPENNLQDQPSAKESISLREKVGIEVSGLKDIDLESIGTLDSSTGGFAKNMWGNTSRTTIDNLFNFLPNQLYSRSLQSLYKRLLLTTAEIPAVTENSTSTGLLFKRARALFYSGYFIFSINSISIYI